jgi:hypothetical protein
MEYHTKSGAGLFPDARKITTVTIRARLPSLQKLRPAKNRLPGFNNIRRVPADRTESLSLSVESSTATMCTGLHLQCPQCHELVCSITSTCAARTTMPGGCHNTKFSGVKKGGSCEKCRKGSIASSLSDAKEALATAASREATEWRLGPDDLDVHKDNGSSPTSGMRRG